MKPSCVMDRKGKKMGTILDVNDVTILENNREYIMTGDNMGMIGLGPDLLPIVTLNGKAYKFSRDELIELAYEQLSKNQE